MGGCRFGLALTGSLILHAGLWWWQPVQPPQLEVADRSMLQVSLLQPARSVAAPAELLPSLAEMPPVESEPPSNRPAESVVPEIVTEKPDTAPATPASVEPSPVEPKPAEPEPAEPEPAEPAKPVTEPKSTELDPVEPDPVEPEPAEPATADPQPPAPAVAEPRPAEPRPAEAFARTEPEASNASPTPSAESTESAAAAEGTSADMVPARVLDNPHPTYPRLARRRGLEGRVVLEVEVLPDGHPGRIEVVNGSGHAVLDQAALEALRNWRFEPAREGGRAISATLQVPVSFQLR